MSSSSSVSKKTKSSDKGKGKGKGKGKDKDEKSTEQQSSYYCQSCRTYPQGILTQQQFRDHSDECDRKKKLEDGAKARAIKAEKEKAAAQQSKKRGPGEGSSGGKKNKGG